VYNVFIRIKFHDFYDIKFGANVIFLKFKTNYYITVYSIAKNKGPYFQEENNYFS